MRSPQRGGHARRFAVVLILQIAGKMGVAVAQVAGQKTAALRDVYPGQQRRIAGGIRRAVAADAGHPQMDGFDFGDQPLRLGGRAEVVTDTNWLVRRRRPIISSRKLE